MAKKLVKKCTQKMGTQNFSLDGNAKKGKKRKSEKEKKRKSEKEKK